MALNLWPVPHGLEDLLNPIGVTGSNPNKVAEKIWAPDGAVLGLCCNTSLCNICLDSDSENFIYPSGAIRERKENKNKKNEHENK